MQDLTSFLHRHGMFNINKYVKTLEEVKPLEVKLKIMI